MKNQSVGNRIDYISILLYFTLVIMGWMTIYSASLPLEETSIFDITQIYGRQMLFIGLTIPLILIILFSDAKIFERLSFVFYGIGILLLLGLFVFGVTKKGQTNWYQFGGFGFQPSEFVKTATALLLAKYLSYSQINLKFTKHQIIGLSIIGIPILLILMQPDAGSAMIFLSLIFVLNREGLPSWYFFSGIIAVALFFLSLVIQPIYLIGILFVLMIIHYIFNRKISRNPIVYGLLYLVMAGFSFSVSYVYDKVLEPHQKDRINVLIGDDVDMKREGYNLNQSMIAIGSGGLIGKGYLEGTQTKGGFVPEQHTDYIFTTVGEEWGFAGSLTVILLFVALFLRIIYLAENQKTKFSRVYGYCVATYLFTHFFVNIAMLIKLFPTIGVPLPFFSYGGSSLWSFTILLFIFIKLDANKVNEW
ncbi:MULTISPECIES: rod shape-determining protein RodA [unclassified Flavobacterium]|uniref:rod shape-determining protein RodA n=1 Tax=unclassified Flavobacterium TaxID=196869 RepID=UPI001290CA37|nr:MULTISPECIES: rod shape-determining protein RodA [unclassified Flavobacterium]MQP52636.1 rod shape-determining protein RodA [Flavobacterium sp. LMO9]MQP62184.1 rod shape-determining protein RodA [Flavobacterium sp. LMO6]